MERYGAASAAPAREPVLQQEPAHIEDKRTAQSRHLIFRNADRAVGAWAEESEDSDQALLLFEGDLAAVTQKANNLAPFCRIVRTGGLPLTGNFSRNIHRQSLKSHPRIGQRRVVVQRNGTEGDN
jgi:hypothetical protein